jgi:F-type H+-transporting ATPase subunit a
MDAEHATPGAAHTIPELPNVITILSQRHHDHPAVAWLHKYENPVFAVSVALVVAWAVTRCTRRLQPTPRGAQNVFELFADGMDRFVQSITGAGGRQHVPFIGTLFLYIWFMNLSGLIPGIKSATASLNTTLGLALVVFGYVQWVAISQQGLLKYLHHLAGSPQDPIGWALVPLMLPLHVLGELIRPISLSLRLGFNVFAEDVLLAVLVGLGLTAGLAMHSPVGLPLQIFVVPLVLIFSTVQALVFSLLSTVYIALATPHGEHHDEAHGAEPHGSAGAHGAHA